MTGFKINLVNLPTNIKDDITQIIREERLGSYYLTHDMSENGVFTLKFDDSDLTIMYQSGASQSELESLKANKKSPLILISDKANFELERTAKHYGIDLLVQADDTDLVTLVYGFIRQYRIYQNQKVLIVDDSHVDSMMTASILSDEFIPHTVLRDPREAISILQQDEQINIVLLDYEMPHLNGVELYKKIRQELPDRNLVFVGLTGSRNGHIQYLKEGLNEALSKPIDAEVLALNLRKTIFNAYEINQEKKQISDYQLVLRRLSHDVYNPLNILVNMNELILLNQEEGFEVDREEVREIFQESKNQIERIFSDVNGYLSLTSHKVEMKMQTCRLNNLIATQLFIESQQAKLKNIIINNNLTYKIDAYCIPNQIESVITNLTSNAVKYSPKGGEIDVRLFEQDNQIIFEVEDTAIKIPEEEMSDVFLPYKKASNIKPTGGEKSTGLGLAICKEIIDAHAGEIGVKHGSRGNVFYFKLPNDSYKKSA